MEDNKYSLRAQEAFAAYFEEFPYKKGGDDLKPLRVVAQKQTFDDEGEQDHSRQPQQVQSQHSDQEIYDDLIEGIELLPSQNVNIKIIQHMLKEVKFLISEHCNIINIQTWQILSPEIFSSIYLKAVKTTLKVLCILIQKGKDKVEVVSKGSLINPHQMIISFTNLAKSLFYHLNFEAEDQNQLEDSFRLNLEVFELFLKSFCYLQKDREYYYKMFNQDALIQEIWSCLNLLSENSDYFRHKFPKLKNLLRKTIFMGAWFFHEPLKDEQMIERILDSTEIFDLIQNCLQMSIEDCDTHT